jgi:hypothetical protein
LHSLPQWLLLMQYTAKASWWILFSTIALMLGSGEIMDLAIRPLIHNPISLELVQHGGNNYAVKKLFKAFAISIFS